MMKILRLIYLFLGICCINYSCLAQVEAPTTPPEESPMPMKPEMTEIWEPQVEKITPGKKPGDAPSDAIILFEGDHLDQWVSQNDSTKTVPWAIKDGYFEVVPGTGGIQTKMKFGDLQIHIEWSAPDKVENSGQGRGNSGLFLQNRYELQILDSYNNRSYSNGQAASIYKDTPPLVNAMRSPDQWNVYDVIYTAPRFRNGKLDQKARITVLHNGVVVQNNTTIQGLTYYIGLHNYPEAHGEDVIALQDHGTKVQFRNIWVRRL
ncbi:3-keto-disaccharide hydrolase [Zunongwangia endophytica]|uniref:DUF1080 domain-containing protein n=1 Tax=Zunongwangia endophytica TaxID=1808945 RepID=A0ABV8H7K7_9FLAO|nr:DUF1080 domain-containing protein [Zunongwangia endophytica]MDN3593721.1 DUF1080 domain-containing protein [Zunongwangia endophytica]